MASWRNDLLPVVLLSALIVGLLVIATGAALKPGYSLAPALVWSLGFCVSGMLLGFLFGIPRTLPPGAINIVDHQQQAAGTQAAGGADDAGTTTQPGHDRLHVGAHAPNEINSNLVEVSDWLTKIIVGVGLVELKDLPENAQSVANFVAPGLAIDRQVAASVAGGIILYFSVLGFLIGYLLTRIYLAIIIKRADNLVILQNRVRLPSGKEIEVGELTKLQQTAIDHLQETVTQLVQATPVNFAAATNTATRAAASGKAVRRVLWVDDRPANNTLLVEQLELINVKVKQVITTQEALAELEREPYDLVITDMARSEEGRRVQNAGVVVTRQAKSLRPELPVFVYCSRSMANLHGKDAQQAGASLVTTSGSTLLAVIRPILDPPAAAPEAPEQPR